MISVRASSLTEYPDCERRFSARHLPGLIESAGFRLRQVSSSIGATVGTAVHAGAAQMLREKMASGEDNKPDSVALDMAVSELRTDVERGAVWDDTTPTMNAAEGQTIRMVQAYRHGVLPGVTPIAVEQALEATFSATLTITGHMDVAEQEIIHDTKTGVMRRPNHPQYGAYSLLRRSNKGVVNGFIEDYVPRSSLKQPQRAPERHIYPVASCEQAAHNILKRIDAAAQAFAQDGDPWRWLPNPASMLCGDRFCPAFATAFCRVHQGAK